MKRPAPFAPNYRAPFMPLPHPLGEREPMPTRRVPSAGGASPSGRAIVIDTREQLPLPFPAGVQTVRAKLDTGDYSVTGYESAFTVERKSLPDLVQTVIHDRARFERELERMTAYDFRRLLVVAPFAAVESGQYRFSAANPRAVIASVCAFEVRYGVPVAFAADEREAVRRVMYWARYYVREREGKRR